jgi:Ras-related protein Rab-1A
MELNYDYLFKIIIIGDSGIGKSAILFRFADDMYNDSYISTIGVDFKIKTIFINGKMIKLQIWDTAGQERFRTITTSYYRGSHMIFLCYDITDRETFTNLNIWVNEIKNLASGNVRVIVCGTKLDLAHKRQVSKQEGQTFADTYGFDYYETSAKQNKNIDELFEKSSEKMLSNFLSLLNNNSNNSNNLITTKKQILSNSNTISIGTRNFKDEVQKKCCI